MAGNFSIRTADVIFSYACNLNCFYCLYRPEREKKKLLLLSPERCREVFEQLKSEGVELESITIYGGEVMILDRDYLEELIRLCKVVFPRAVLGTISNLIYLDEGILSLLLKHEVVLSTSYDSLRFDGKSELFREWQKNFLFLNRKGIVKDVLTVASTRMKDDEKIIADLLKKVEYPFRWHVYQLFIPEGVSDEEVRKYVLSPREYVSVILGLRKRYGQILVTHNAGEGFMFNHIHVFPDGRVGLAGPSSEKGYPYEKVYVFSSNSSESISFSPVRFKYVKEQMSYCLPCEFYPRECFAEFFYPQGCFGVKVLLEESKKFNERGNEGLLSAGF